MATSVSFNGSTYSIPVVGERQWGTNVSNFLIAVAGNALSKAGGSFVLTTADVNFGTSYGLVTAYIKGAVGNIAATGVIRFANTNAITWRNSANSADLSLLVNASDRLEFGGVNIPTISSTDTLTNKTMSGASNTFTNMPVGTTGTLAKANGGTGVTSATTAQTAGEYAAWDANQNLSANNIVNDYATTATAAGTTTLTVASKRVQFFTGTSTQTVTLPVASTLTVGHNYYIRNLSTGVVTVQSSGANSVIAMQPQDGIIVTCILASGTSAASWSVFSELANSAATGALSLPAGTAAQRPTAVAGQVRLNTDSNSFEGYANGAWSSIGGGLNELPQKNYLKTWSDAVVAPGTLSTLASTTANLVSLTAFYADATSGSSALTSSTSSTLRGTTNYLTAAGAADATGARFIQFPAQALEGTDLGKPISIYFDVNGVTADGNWDAVIVRYNSSGTHQSIISIAGNASTGTTPVSAKLPTGTTTFNGFFVPDSTTAGDLYALRLRHLVSNAAIRVDTLFIGPQPIRVGAAITDWQSYTPALTNGTNITPTGWWRQNGSNMDIVVSLIATSGSGSGGGVLIGLPNSKTIDTAITSSANGATIGSMRFLDSSVLNHTGVAQVASSTTIGFQRTGVAASVSGTDFTINDAVYAIMTVPIVGWSSNITMADRAVESYAADDGSSDVFGPNGALVPNIGTSTGTTFRSFTFQEAKQATDNYILEYNFGGNGWSQQNGIWNYIEGTGSYSYGMRGFWNGATTYVVQFGNGGVSPTNGWGAAGGTAWSVEFTNGDRFRVRRVSGGGQVGYPISSANIVGRVDGNAPATGMVGEKIEASISTTAATTSEADITGASLALTSGRWEIKYSVTANYTTGATSANAGYTIVGITDSANTHVGRSDRMVFCKTVAAVANVAYTSLSASTVIDISSSTTYKLRLKRVDTAGTGTGGIEVSTGIFDCTFYAIRIA